jgi:hypothetical protein
MKRGPALQVCRAVDRSSSRGGRQGAITAQID